MLNASLNEELSRLRHSALSDKDNLKELYAKIEGKSSEIQELIKYKEKTQHLKEENLKLARSRDKLEQDYMQFHSELKKLKDRMKLLLQQNDELLNEKLFYETKVDRLEARISELAYKATSGRQEDPDKLKSEIQKLRSQNRKLVRSFQELSPLNETIKKIEGREEEEILYSASQTNYKLRSGKDFLGGKILPINE